MKQLPVEMLKEGMIIAEDLTDMMDRVIMKRGSALTEPYIKKLGRWGIEVVAVEVEDDGSGGGNGATGGGELSDERKAEIEAMFVAHEGNANMMALKPIAFANQFGS